ncbi:unnamed protein product [Adineta steineri]|uniref:Uncharacterized protein n=1 Tax=Adineta steineri TaxID=433720 RepID=A0A815YYA0_9BILA|nr:unnamed protein product [Adineta steineri]CAF1671909.1 unnamed protein product [Adineta steineri]
MYPDMCYLIPRGAMKKIPQCQPNSKIMQKHAKELKPVEKAKITTTKRSTTRSITTVRIPWTTPLIASPTKSSVISRTNSSIVIRTPLQRVKRWLAALIPIGIGTGSLIMSAIDFVQNRNLKSQVNMMHNAIKTLGLMSQNQQAQILHLNEGEFKVARELNYTQVALNKTIALVNEHGDILREHTDALRTIMSQTSFLNSRLNSIAHTMETHFIHTSMHDILSNRLNLHFVHQKDLPNVVDMVTKSLNITFDDADNSVPMIELITRLLVRQQIDFLPCKTPDSTDAGLLIGNLVFTSYFAAPSQDQVSFSVYEVVPIPFTHSNRRVRLAQMPAYLEIESSLQQFIRWSKEEAAACDFEVMSSCRETPPSRKEASDDCLYQVLTDSTLTACRTELYTDRLFLRRVGHHWAISSNQSVKCHSVTSSDLEHHTIGNNEEVILPPVALITTMNTKSLACDQFFLPGLAVTVATPIQLIYNASVNRLQKDFLDLQETLANETHWAKLPYISSEVQAIIEFIQSTPKPITTGYLQQWTEHPFSLTTLILVAAMVVLCVLLLYYIRTKIRTGANMTITMPSCALELMTLPSLKSTAT